MKIIGHRGARGLAPENTLASLQKAVAHGVDQIEFDVRVTKDQIPVLLHDSSLADASGTELVLAEHSYDELKLHKPDLTTLAEVFIQIPKTMPLYIEIKPHEPVAPIVALLKASKRADDTLSLGSYSQPSLRQLHTALPGVHLIVIERWSGVRASLRARELGTTEVSMNQRWLWWGFIKSVSRRGWQLNAYTLNDPRKAARWQKYGLNGAITDYPDRFEH